MSLKQALLTPVNLAPVTVTAFDAEFKVQRLATARLTEFHARQKELQAANDGEGLNQLAAGLVLHSLLDENGNPMIESVTIDELLAAQPPVAINAALTSVMQANYATSEGLEDAKKD
ncbi:MAG: hypothetical protein OIF55_16915 [Amphritea sp.]|nr:hypothetical protein [Amphritea sp.]